MPLYSYSRIETFENCPRQYKFKYVEKVKVDVGPTVEQHLGTAAHKALERCYRLVQIGRPMSKPELTAVFRQAWEEVPTDKLRVAREDFAADDYFRLGLKALEQYHDRHFPFDREMTLDLEKLVIMPLDEEGEFKLQGYIDRLSRDPSGRLRIHDYKTSGHLPTQAEIGADRQLALYQIAVEKMWPDVTGVELVWHYLRFDTTLVSHRTPEQLENLKREYQDRIRKIETGVELGNFPTRESALCDWCDYFPLCPAKGAPAAPPTTEEKPAVLDKKDVAQTVDRYIKLKVDKDAVEEELERLRQGLVGLGEIGSTRFLAGSGDQGVTVSITQASKLPTESADSDKHKQVVALVKGAGLFPRFAKLDTNSLEKALDAGSLPPALKKELQELREIVSRSVVRVRK